MFSSPHRENEAVHVRVHHCRVCVCPCIICCWCLSAPEKEIKMGEREGRKRGEVRRDEIEEGSNGRGRRSGQGPYISRVPLHSPGAVTQQQQLLLPFRATVTVIRSNIYPPSNNYQQPLWTNQSTSPGFSPAEGV